MAYSVRWGRINVNQKLATRNVYTTGGYICAACARSQRRSLLTTANLAIRRSRIANQLGINTISRRALHDEQKEPEHPADLQSTIDNLILKNEFEANNDIRDYLRKWTNQNVNYLDPVQGPGTSNPVSTPTWVGNMLNDTMAAYESAIEQSEHLTDESSEFKVDMDEPYEVGDMILEPGDLVGFHAGFGLLTPAIYIRSVERQKQFYTLRGKWRIATDKDIDIVVKNFVPKELTDIVIPYFPTTTAVSDTSMQAITEGGVPRTEAAPLIRKLQEFSDREKRLFRANAKKIDDLYSSIASPNERRVLTLTEIAAKALDISTDEVTPEALFMTHKAILRLPFLVSNDRSTIFTDMYLVQPKRVADSLNTVWDWVRDHEEHLTRLAQNKTSVFTDHPMQKFLSKARRMITQSRQVRSPTTMSSVGPSAQRIAPEETDDGHNYKKVVTEKFDSNDRIILDCLLYYSIPPLRFSTGIARYTGIHIMRATGMYTAIELQRGSVPLLLQELGVLPAWHNLYAMDQLLALPTYNIDPATEKSEEVARQAAAEPNRYEEDAMADTRVDWGDLPIYCIDDPGAKEIDDGISLEPVPGSNDEFWLRVHVANPTAFVPHDDPVSENASQRLTTVYLPERHFPMIPEDLAHANFSLARGRPTFTISAKVNLNGDVLETDITNGLAQNVIYMTHRKLRSIFDPNMEASKTLKVGGDLPGKPEGHFKDALTQEETETFLTLRKIMTKIHMKWKENGGLTWPDSFGRQNPVIHSGKQIPPYVFPDPPTEGGYYVGDPAIGITLNTVDPYDIPDMSQRNLVSLVMQFACQTAGRWGAERNIPLVYSGTYFHPEYPPLTPEIMKTFTSKDWSNFTPPKAYNSSSVVAHSGLGVDAYTKTTSPLRRYTDLLAHYQIEAALRYEKKHGKKFDGAEAVAASSLPFSTSDVDHVLERMRLKFPLINLVQNQSNYFWISQFLFRAFYFGECELPETMPCLVRQKVDSTAAAVGTHYVSVFSGQNLPFGIRTRLFATEEFRDIDPLSTVEAKIVAVNMGQHVVDMEIVRKVKGWERTGDWA